MRKVMVVGSDFRWYHESFARAFKKVPCAVEVVVTQTDIPRRALIARIKRFLRFDISDYYEERIRKQSEAVKSRFDEIKPEIVFVKTGNQLNLDAVQYMSQSATTVLYMTDSMERYQQLSKVVCAYSLVYSFEESDIPRLRELGIEGRVLSGTLDTDQYFPINETKDIDICFVGVMYPFRLRILNNIVADFPMARIVFEGKFINYHQPVKYLSYLLRGQNKVFTNRNIHYSEVNKLYNRAKICLNLQHPQSKSGWNSRLCEILGTGSFQIVNSNPAIEKHFKTGLVTFSDYQDLKCKIAYYLENDDERSEIAGNGYNMVTGEHTVYISVERILDDIDALKKNVGGVL